MNKIKILIFSVIIGVAIFLLLIIVPVLAIIGLFSSSDDDLLYEDDESSSSDSSSSNDSSTGSIEVVSSGDLYYPKVGGSIKYTFCYPVTNFVKLTNLFGKRASYYSNGHTGVDFARIIRGKRCCCMCWNGL